MDGRAGEVARSVAGRGRECRSDQAFNPSNGWNVAAIEPDRVQTRHHVDGAPAWLATIKRI